MAELPRDIPDENLKRWLALTPEDAIDPEQPIVDPHHHLWDRRSLPESPPGSRRHVVYLADELIEDIRGAGPQRHRHGLRRVPVQIPQRRWPGRAGGRDGVRTGLRGKGCFGGRSVLRRHYRFHGSHPGRASKRGTPRAPGGRAQLSGDSARPRLARIPRNAQVPPSHRRHRRTSGSAGVQGRLRRARRTRSCLRLLGFPQPVGRGGRPGERLSRRHHHPQPYRRDRSLWDLMRASAKGGCSRSGSAVSRSYPAARTSWSRSAAAGWRPTASVSRIGMPRRTRQPLPQRGDPTSRT